MAVLASGFEVSEFGFGVWGLGVGVWGLGFGGQGFGFRVSHVGFRVSHFGFRVQSTSTFDPALYPQPHGQEVEMGGGNRLDRVGFSQQEEAVEGVGWFQVSHFGFQVSHFGCRVSGFGFRPCRRRGGC